MDQAQPLRPRSLGRLQFAGAGEWSRLPRLLPPCGDFFEETQWKHASYKGRNKGHEAEFMLDADDILLCMDAKTGKAYNTRVLGGTAYCSPCVEGGRPSPARNTGASPTASWGHSWSSALPVIWCLARASTR